MERSQILELIEDEIRRLERVREILSTSNGHGSLTRQIAQISGAPKKRFLSEEARNRIAQAQKRRWAKQRKETTAAKKAG